MMVPDVMRYRDSYVCPQHLCEMEEARTLVSGDALKQWCEANPGKLPSRVFRCRWPDGKGWSCTYWVIES